MGAHDQVGAPVDEVVEGGSAPLVDIEDALGAAVGVDHLVVGLLHHLLQDGIEGLLRPAVPELAGQDAHGDAVFLDVDGLFVLPHGQIFRL